MKYFLKTFLLLWGLALYLPAQAQEYQSDNNYKNLQNNLRNLDNSLERQDVTGAKRFLKYSQKFIDKVKAAYPEANLEAEEDRMQVALAKINEAEAAEAKVEAIKEEVLQWKYPIEQLYTVSFQAAQADAFWEKFQNFKREEVLQKIATLPSTQQGGQVAYLKEMIKNHKERVRTMGTLVQMDKILETAQGRQSEAEIQPLLRMLEVACQGHLLINPQHFQIKAKLLEVNGLLNNMQSIINNHKPVERKKFKDALPQAVTSDSQIEAGMVEAIRFQKFPGVRVDKALMTEATWQDERNDKGERIGRTIEAAIVMKNTQGDCFFQYFNFRQPTSGAGYGKIMRKSSGSRYYVNCDKIP